MKTTLLSLLIAMMIPAVSSAKVEDFNAMIDESAQAQMDLRHQLKEQLAETRQADLRTPKKVLEIADDQSGGVNVTTRRDLLTFEKEKSHYRAKDAKKMDRFANELNAYDKAF